MLKHIKTILALLLVAAALFTCAGAETALAGGWTAAEDPAVTEELRALFDKGMEGLLGVSYKPVAYLGSQVVAGRNHCFLAQATVIYPDARPSWVLIYLYEDLSGNVSLMNIAEFDFGSSCTYGAAE